MKLTAVILASVLAMANADCYLSNPKGSNNRLNEKSANRQNGNRLFDSQNNNRGGYNVGDKGTNAAANQANNLRLAPNAIYANNNDNAAVQYPMLFYGGSQIPLEWTVQHGCGGNEATDPNKLNCNMVVQYMCDQDVDIPKTANVADLAMTVKLADGTNTNTPDAVNCNNAGNQRNNVNNQENQNNNNARGRHESEGFYCECQQRNRQANLFTADQNLAGNAAQYTRQNPNGARRGLECPEERDYYPYWSPTPFRDLAYLTDDVSRCKMIQTESQNVKEKYKCTEANGALNKAIINGITEADCTADGGRWTLYNSYGIPAPDCQAAGYSRVNHLGNGRGDQVSPNVVGYNATIPNFNQLTADQTTYKTRTQNTDYVKCALRVRYNISTDDYDPWTINSASNNAKSPVKQNPNVAVGATAKLQLAINTNQFGRTFQDRSHTFYVRKPTAAMATAMAAGASVINLNVRGKRGNIVQTYPAHEYDFVPTMVEASSGDIIHMQWTGSNTHNNGNPGGDGQTGDAGEGTGGTDRQNMVQFRDFDDNFYAPYEKLGSAGQLGIPDLFGDKNKCSTALNPIAGNIDRLDCSLRQATSGYYRTASEVGDKAMNPTLDNTPASSVNGGTIVVLDAPVGTVYKYGSSRNNNFTNRGQKGEMRIIGA